MRFEELTEDRMNAEQLVLYREICAGPRRGFHGPLHMLIRSPELARHASNLGEYVRYNSSLEPRISEFAILIAARYWTSQYEWHVHSAHAKKAGLAPNIIAELALGKRPSNMQDDEAAAWQFCTELHYRKSVTDDAFAAAMKRFGEKGVVDLMGVCGYYTLMSMAVNLNQQALPEGAPLPLAPLNSVR